MKSSILIVTVAAAGEFRAMNPDCPDIDGKFGLTRGIVLRLVVHNFTKDIGYYLRQYDIRIQLHKNATANAKA